MATVYIGTVVDINDPNDGERIKVRVLPADKYKSDSDIPYAFPLLPKMLHIKPKVGEAALIICENENNPQSQRYYVGPLISQSHLHYNEDAISSTALLKGGVKAADPAASTEKKAIGAFAKDNDIAIYGRKNGDIIITDDDVRIRCGAHLVNEVDNNDIKFNNQSPSFIKLKYYPNKLKEAEKKLSPLQEILNQSNKNTEEKVEADSTVTVVGDKINLISANGSPYFNTCDTVEGISDDDMIKILKEAHQLPYGDELVKFLVEFLKMFKSHTHKYHNMEPCPDSQSTIFDLHYGSNEEDIKNKLLSKSVRIN